MKLDKSNSQTINKVIEMYLNNPFTEFTVENLKPIREQTALGYTDIKSIILKHINREIN